MSLSLSLSLGEQIRIHPFIHSGTLQIWRALVTGVRLLQLTRDLEGITHEKFNCWWFDWELARRQAGDVRRIDDERWVAVGEGRGLVRVQALDGTLRALRRQNASRDVGEPLVEPIIAGSR